MVEKKGYFDSRATTDNFLSKLWDCEQAIRYLNDFDADFIKDLRAKWNVREDMDSLGLAPLWEPTTKQINYLRTVWEKL